ncbi:MAG TPA: M50 family metallopeptidase, partial [Anaerolineales bacterium]|nr:M50 family metallopeptidase [Anaerolineales bacterium]
IPLGGFVRPKGENDPTIPGGLASASPWKRLGVLFAGPGINILTGILLAILLFYTLGEPILDKVRVDEVAADSPAMQAGLLAGDIITEVDGVRIDSMNVLQETIQTRLDKSITVSVDRSGEKVSVTLTPRSNPPANQGAIGVLLGNPTRPIPVTTAITGGFSASFEYMRAVLALPVRLIRGENSPEDGRAFVGYKGMFDIYQQIRNPLYFFMAVTFSLGLINLFPIPALDGGRILLTLPEIILKRRIPAQYENMIHLVGFAVLLLLLIYINIQDFVNPVVLPK